MSWNPASGRVFGTLIFSRHENGTTPATERALAALASKRGTILDTRQRLAILRGGPTCEHPRKETFSGRSPVALRPAFDMYLVSLPLHAI